MEVRTIFRKLGKQNGKKSSGKFFRGTLVDMLQKRGDCAVCLFCEEELKKFYWWYFYDYHGKPSWIIRVSESNGFCCRHGWDILKMKKASQMSFVYRYLVKDTLKKLEKMASQGYKESRKYIKPTNICPICEQITDISTSWTRQLVKYLEDEEIKELYLSSSGLCMNHFDQAFFFASPNVCLILIEKQSREFKKLSSDLEEFSSALAEQICKPGEEKAYIRAIGLFTGRRL